jgi:cytochrome d ubiquinol oxidase subunit I
MIPTEEVVDISRLQFAVVALYHFLFVPLTLGLTFILAMMESVYVMTGKQVYKDMTKFWGKLFIINFAIGVATGLTMEFSFGTNWSYYSHYVGDIFGAPLAIEGLMAFFLESTFVGMFLFGWDRLSKVEHLVVTWLMAIGTNLSALWILIANGWMQNPVGARLNIETMRMELTSFTDILFNPVAQVKFIHTVAAGYVAASMFVLSISAWYLLKGRDTGFAKRSFAIAAAFGTAGIFSVILLGDESGYEVGHLQEYKLAAIEAEWETHEAPAGFTVFAIPDQEAKTNHYEVKIPYALGIIAKRSLTEEVKGIQDILVENEARIRSGMIAYGYFEKIRKKEATPEDIEAFRKLEKDFGYGLLLKQYTPNVVDATEEQIQRAVQKSIPDVAPLFYMFRIMVGSGVIMLFVFVAAFVFTAKRTVFKKRWFLWVCVVSLPLPWIAIEAGWFVAEYGRQPWAIGEILPTALASSNLEYTDVLYSLIAFIIYYTVLLIIELFLITKYVRLGPSSLQTGRYHFEKNDNAGDTAGKVSSSTATNNQELI